MKKILSILLALALLCGSAGTVKAETSYKATFPDVKDTKAYYYVPVYWGVEKGIIAGFSDGTFRPKANCTRGQAVTFLWRLAGSPAPKTAKNPFKDVRSTEGCYKAVLWASEKGIAAGYSDGTFHPHDVCKREHVMTFLWRYAGKPAPGSDKSSFKDVKAGKYYYKAVLWAVENGITTGYSDGTFRPAADCLREHIATFIYRFANLPAGDGKWKQAYYDYLLANLRGETFGLFYIDGDDVPEAAVGFNGTGRYDQVTLLTYYGGKVCNLGTVGSFSSFSYLEKGNIIRNALPSSAFRAEILAQKIVKGRLETIYTFKADESNSTFSMGKGSSTASCTRAELESMMEKYFPTGKMRRTPDLMMDDVTVYRCNKTDLKKILTDPKSVTYSLK